jgi:hypothetical protein
MGTLASNFFKATRASSHTCALLVLGGSVIIAFSSMLVERNGGHDLAVRWILALFI